MWHFLRRALLFVLVGVCVSLFAERSAQASDAASFMRSSLKETPAERLQHALHQFANWANWLEMLLAVALSTGLATLLAYHPRSSRRRDLVEASDERRVLVILGVIGAVVASLVVIDQTMAFVIFGIGSLIRFRTVIGNPHTTGRAILVVVIGLACGLTQFMTAIIVAGAGWIVLWWLHARRAAVVKVRVPAGADRGRAQVLAAEALRGMHCRVDAQRLGASGRSFTLTLQAPAALSDELLEQGIASTVGAEFPRVEVELRGA